MNDHPPFQHLTNGLFRNLTILEGNFREVMETLEDNSIDLIYTDPPYPKIYLPLYIVMAEIASRKLKPGGSLVSILPHYALPVLIEGISNHLKWRWMYGMWQMNDAHSRMAMGIEVIWKPMGWWVKGSWPSGRGFIKDGFENEKRSKKLHKWEQNNSWAYYAKEFVKAIPHAVIVDPFFGSGTLGLLAPEGYKVIGIDSDPEAIKIAKERYRQ